MKAPCLFLKYKYTPITEDNIEKAAMLYMNHYNQHSGGCWTYEKAYKRIRQMVTMEDSLCLMQEDDNDIPTGLVIGFLKATMILHSIISTRS